MYHFNLKSQCKYSKDHIYYHYDNILACVSRISFCKDLLHVSTVRSANACLISYTGNGSHKHPIVNDEFTSLHVSEITNESILESSVNIFDTLDDEMYPKSCHLPKPTFFSFLRKAWTIFLYTCQIPICIERVIRNKGLSFGGYGVVLCTVWTSFYFLNQNSNWREIKSSSNVVKTKTRRGSKS